MQSRYYDPEMGRFISADAYASTGQGWLGNNMFAYCNNNPVSGYDSSGRFFSPIESQIKTTYIYAPGNRGTELQQMQMDAGNFAGQLVVDASVSFQNTPVTYRKYGAAFVIDFDRTEINMYPHVGAGIGLSSGPSISIGYVGNYETPDDYARDFLDVNLGYYVGLDHCFNPYESHKTASQATALTIGTGFNSGVGYDFYSSPILIVDWEGK